MIVAHHIYQDIDARVSALRSLWPAQDWATREQLRAVLGKPNDWSTASRRQRLPAVWKYGVIEFHFGTETDTVKLIHADDFERLHAAQPNCRYSAGFNTPTTDG